MSENTAAALSYVLGWITGLIFLLIDKRPYVKFHAAQSLVTFGALHILHIALGMIFGVGILTGGLHALGAGFLLLQVLSLAIFVLWIFLIVKASQGNKFKLPMAGDIAESIAGK